MTKLTIEQTDRIVELKRLGLRNKEIAQELGLDPKKVSAVLIANGMRTHAPKTKKPIEASGTLTCPTCKRGGFPKDYRFCPYCTADIRTEKGKLLDLLKRTQELFTPPHSTEKDSKASYAFSRAIDYLEAQKDA